MFLGIEIGGTKLQLGVGRGDGRILGLWRGSVNPYEGGGGIRRQLVAAVPELLAKADLDRGALRGVGIGFGGPTDDATQTVIKSHQIEGWDNFPLANWMSEQVGLPAVLCNDADTAGLGEALFGAGQGLSPIFYITIGSGTGGGLVLNGEIYRGVGRGAAEIGHLMVEYRQANDEHGVGTLESVASGWGIERRARAYLQSDRRGMSSSINALALSQLKATDIAAAAKEGDEYAAWILDVATDALAEAISQTITLLCPRRVVIGGGVSLMGEALLFEPLRRKVAGQTFEPFASLTDIVPAALGEEVVIHGALALARKKFGGL